MSRWKPLAVLGTATFLMVLDTSVMNVSISQLVADFHTEVTTIQAVITLYTLVMAGFMIIGGKMGDLWGRRRTFGIGLVVYGCGSAITAISPTVAWLALGWSVIEGLGAALVLPALAALVGGNYTGRDRITAYGVTGGLAGVGVAVGPLIGGWVTTNLTWRLVFAGEVVIVIVLLALVRWIHRGSPTRPTQFDGFGAVLSVAGLSLVVLSVLQAGTWGWLQPRQPPFTILTFSPTLFVLAAGIVILLYFGHWQRRREDRGRDPLVRMELFGILPLRSGLLCLLAQNLVLLGLFFAIPLYLQIVQGLNAFETGVRLLPMSATMLIASLSGPWLSGFVSARRIVRLGLVVMCLASLWLLATVRPELNGWAFAGATALLGVGMGLLASQLGNVVQSSVGDSARSEVGGLQYTAQNLGSSLGTALIGSILIGGLTVALSNQVADNAQISAAVRDQVGIAIESGVEFVSTSQVQTALEQAGVPSQDVGSLVANYAAAQLTGLRVAILAAAAVALGALWFTRHLPDQPARKSTEAEVPAAPAAVG